MSEPPPSCSWARCEDHEATPLEVANFQPAGEGKAAITGDFVALESEVQPLIKALRNSGIEVTAIHNHMIDEQPRTFFIHFWANDDALKLAHGLHEALRTVNAAQR